MYRFLADDQWIRSTERGIYLLEGDYLLILTAPPGKPRPVGFARPVAGGTLLVLERQAAPGRSAKPGAAVQPAHAGASAPAADPLVGKWAWFTGGNVTIRKDGTMVHELGNEGTWKRMESAPHVYTLTWRYHDYVDTVTLSDDIQGLAGANQTGYPVDAQRIRD